MATYSGIYEVAFVSKNKEKALAKIGVNIRNLETNEMRDFRDIIQDLNNKFDDLDEATQSYIAESVSATVWQQAEIK